MKFKSNLMSSRIVEKAPRIMATPTGSTIRLNEAAAKLLGVSYDKVLGDGEYIAAGTVNADGKPVTVFILVDAKSELDKAKLASPTKKNGGSLQFASAGVHADLNGDNENNVVWNFDKRYDVDDEGNAVELKDGETAKGTEAFGVSYFETRPAGTIGGSKRKKKKATNPDGTGAAAGANGDGSEEEEEEEEDEDGDGDGF